ncbi:hypothetical protein [Brevundimonas viscosa]|uniref:Uncharacterized protein n=1 Tax=Brevundimonas viscosa TaxID=871741 RepID=A0A1I6PQ73_9CAUL|nr:hypothetical protein [Brevundimonas viscosa]SFS42336.1 hypothetical protein SAMN05192570_1174 [Brevundimonas viscosa]
MTGFDYTRAAATAERLIQKFGQTGKLRVETPGSGPSYDPGEPTITDHDAVMAVLEFEKSDVDGTRILATDKRILVAAKGLPVEPSTEHQLLDAAGQAYSVIAVDPLSPAGVPVFYWVQARR